MKKRSDDSAEALSIKLDGEIARRKDLSLKLAEKEAQLAALSAAVDEEDAALERETAEKKAELERLRDSIAQTAALLERRNGDAVRIAADAAGVDKALTALKAQMASRFVPSVSHALQLSEAEAREIAGSSRPKNKAPSPLTAAVGADDGAVRSLTTEVSAWGMADYSDGFTLDDPDLLAGELTSRVSNVLVIPPEAPAAAPPPPQPPNRAGMRRGSMRSTAGSRAASAPRHEVAAPMIFGCSEDEAQRLLHDMLDAQVRRVGQLVVAASHQSTKRLSFDELATVDSALPPPGS